MKNVWLTFAMTVAVMALLYVFFMKYWPDYIAMVKGLPSGRGAYSIVLLGTALQVAVILQYFITRMFDLDKNEIVAAFQLRPGFFYFTAAFFLTFWYPLFAIGTSAQHLSPPNYPGASMMGPGAPFDVSNCQIEKHSLAGLFGYLLYFYDLALNNLTGGLLDGLTNGGISCVRLTTTFRPLLIALGFYKLVFNVVTLVAVLDIRKLMKSA